MSSKLDAVQRAFWGAYGERVDEWFDRAQKSSVVKKIWSKEAQIWTLDPKGQAEARNRLGWLTVAEDTLDFLDEILAFAEEIKAASYKHVVLMGMGGSSLAPEVFASTFGPAAGYPELLILDSTDPERVRDIESRIDLDRTFFIVSSKSGGTVELLSFFKYFFIKIRDKKGEDAGKQFLAITDPGSPLEELAKRNLFRKVFHGDPEVGGRFSALSHFGIVPAALIGVPVKEVLQAAIAMMEATFFTTDIRNNEAANLGIGMAVLAEEGRDKLTILSSSSLSLFGDWAEQLVAESSGKEGVGVVPVVGEPYFAPQSYAEDRFFVALMAEADEDAALLKHLDALEEIGHPVLRIMLKEKTDLGGEFFRWEMATALACALLKINAFDQPDVQAAKDRAKQLLKKVENDERLPLDAAKTALAAVLADVKPLDYVAILAFIPDNSKTRKSLELLRKMISEKKHVAVTVGFGPRYLHSTGQLHKGGANNGVFIVITAGHKNDLLIPGERYSFAQLELAQGVGDVEALVSKTRRVTHVHLKEYSPAALEAVVTRAKEALQ